MRSSETRPHQQGILWMSAFRLVRIWVQNGTIFIALVIQNYTGTFGLCGSMSTAIIVALVIQNFMVAALTESLINLN